MNMQTLGILAQRYALLLAIWLGFTALISGCASNRDATGPNDGVVARVDDTEQEDWFCSPGENQDSWECQRGEPDTIRRPPRRRDESDADSDEFDPFGTDSNPTSATPANSADLTRTDINAPGIAPGINEAGATQPPPPNSPVPDSAPSKPLRAQGQPSYAGFAYQPERPTPILELPGEFFAAQLFAVSTPEQVEDFVERENLINMSAAQVEHKGALYYVLLLGVYETAQAAESAIAAMPRAVRDLNPWIRSVAGLQAAMRRAEDYNSQNNALPTQPTP